jgi:mRNA interferase RelE/StbE
VTYTVVLAKSAQKQLLAFPVAVQKRLSERIEALSADPRPPDVKKLQGRDAWRIRTGDYRVIYEIHDRILRVIVISVGHRGDVYR